MKANKSMKQIMGLALTSIMLLSGCGNQENPTSQEKSVSGEGTTYKIGISQLAEHPALDQVREGFLEELRESGIQYEEDYKNAQGDTINANSIASKFVSDQVDLILGIGTISAQAAKQSTSEIPVLFSAVSDPIGAGLVKVLESPEANITGTTDRAPIKEQMQLFHAIDPNIKKVGIIYNTSEANSLSQIEEVTVNAKELDLEIITIGINNINEVPQAVDSILSKVDALYTITDNTVASAMGAVSAKAIEQKKIIVGSTDTFVEDGNLITLGLSYKELGKQTAKMALQILQNGKSPSEIKVENLTNTTKVINKSTLEAIGLDPTLEILKDGTMVE